MTPIMTRVFNQPLLVTAERAVEVAEYLASRQNRTVLFSGQEGLPSVPPSEEASTLGFGPPRVEGKRFRFDAATGIAYLPVEGTLVHRYGHLDAYSGLQGYDGLFEQLSAAFDDDAVRGVFLDIDSPGGEAAGCFDLADWVYERAKEKPVVAMANELAASAAYALASAANQVWVTRTGIVGSIGTVAMHVDYSAALDMDGIKVSLIHAGARKVDGNPYQALPDDVRADFQARMDETRDHFVSMVARHRGLSEKAVAGTEAAIFTGQAAVAAGLADGVGPAHAVYRSFAETLASRPAA